MCSFLRQLRRLNRSESGRPGLTIVTKPPPPPNPPPPPRPQHTFTYHNGKGLCGIPAVADVDKFLKLADFVLRLRHQLQGVDQNAAALLTVFRLHLQNWDVNRTQQVNNNNNNNNKTPQKVSSLQVQHSTCSTKTTNNRRQSQMCCGFTAV